MLSKKQLEDAAKCEERLCRGCEMLTDNAGYCAQAVAQTALAYREMLERLEFADHSDVGGWKCCPVCGVGINDRNHSSDCELAALLKESEG